MTMSTSVVVGRLVASLTRLLDPATALTSSAPAGLAFTSSRPVGGTLVLDALWRRLGIDTVMIAAGHKPWPTYGTPQGSAGPHGTGTGRSVA
jgi:hypothetical protein